MSLYSQWTREVARGVCQRELMDPSARWWSTAELNQYIDNWQTELQQEMELVWGTATLTVTSSGQPFDTIALSSLTPTPLRMEAIYWGTGSSQGFRLAGRLLQDLEIANKDWRNATPDTPREVIMYDATQIIVWPSYQGTSTYNFEYPITPSFVDDSTTISLPVWAQWSLKPYVCWKAYLKPGPNGDVKKALRYAAAYQKEKTAVKELWNNWLPERYRRLKPVGQYERNILCPPPAWSTN